MRFKLFFSILFIGFIAASYAQQLSKEEKKSLKSELKNYLKKPEDFKQLKESVIVKDKEINKQTNRMILLDKERNFALFQLNEARDSIKYYQTRLISFTKINMNRNTETNTCLDNEGMKYRVQIGVYRDFDIRSFLNEIKVTSFEEVNGMFRYSIGNFKTENEAELFKSAVRKMGITGAFVTYYLDGERVLK